MHGLGVGRGDAADVLRSLGAGTPRQVMTPSSLLFLNKIFLLHFFIENFPAFLYEDFFLLFFIQKSLFSPFLYQ